MVLLANQPTTREATIHRDGRRLYIEPRDPAILRKFRSRTLVPVEDADHGYRVAKWCQSLLGEAEVMPYAGLEWSAIRALQAAGYHVDRRPYCRSLPLPDLRAPRRLGRVDATLLGFVRDNDEGVVRYARGHVEPARLTAEMLLAYPAATVAIVSATNAAAAKCYHQLRRLLSEVTITLAATKNCPAAAGHVVVGTYTSMAHPAIEIEKRHIVIALDAEEALGERAQLMLLAADARFRLFGFLPDDRQLAPRSRDRIFATFGPAELVIPRHGYQAVQGRVMWSPIRGGPALAADAEAGELMRSGVWRHPVRNRRIARLAAVLQGTECSGNDRHLAAVVEAVQHVAAPRIVLLVDAVDHALALADRLPEWQLVMAADIATEGLSRRYRDLLAERRWGGDSGTPLIATTRGIITSTVAIPDVVIWAGAGRHVPPLPPHWLIAPNSVDRELLLIDFADYHDPRLDKWSRARRRAYAEAGWLAPGVDALLARIDRFLDRHQRRPR